MYVLQVGVYVSLSVCLKDLYVDLRMTINMSKTNVTFSFHRAREKSSMSAPAGASKSVLALGVVLASVLTTGCTSSRILPGPNGERMVIAECNGGINSIADCYQEIAEQCPSGYTIVTGNQEATPGSYMYTDAWGNLQAQSYTATKRSLIGVCK